MGHLQGGMAQETTGGQCTLQNLQLFNINKTEKSKMHINSLYSVQLNTGTYTDKVITGQSSYLQSEVHLKWPLKHSW